MGSLFHAVAENYPELRSSDNMARAQDTYEEVEGHIAASRRFYNSSVTALNNSIQIFPGTILASMAGIGPMPYFEETDNRVRQSINAGDYLK